jgi:hypothetical protein
MGISFGLTWTNNIMGNGTMVGWQRKLGVVIKHGLIL